MVTPNINRRVDDLYSQLIKLINDDQLPDAITLFSSIASKPAQDFIVKSFAFKLALELALVRELELARAVALSLNLAQKLAGELERACELHIAVILARDLAQALARTHEFNLKVRKRLPMLEPSCRTSQFILAALTEMQKRAA